MFKTLKANTTHRESTFGTFPTDLHFDTFEKISKL